MPRGGGLHQLNLITLRAKAQRAYEHCVLAGVHRFNGAFLVQRFIFTRSRSFISARSNSNSIPVVGWTSA